MIAWSVSAQVRHRPHSDQGQFQKSGISRTVVTLRDDPSAIMAVMRRCYGHNIGEYMGRATGTRAVDRITSIERLGPACVEGTPEDE